MNNFESVFDNTNSHELLAVVSAVHHERAGQTLDNWAESLVKSLDLITASRVWYIFGRLTFDWYVILGESLKIETKLDNFLFFFLLKKSFVVTLKEISSTLTSSQFHLPNNFTWLA